MQFKQLAKYFSQLDSTTKRLELIAFLSEMYVKVASAEEAKQITYLIQGRVAAFYEPIEFGMGEKLLERSVAQAYESDIEEVKKLNSTLGDIGLVAEELSKKGARHRAVSVDDVFEGLKAITTTSGDGAVEGKIERLCEVLKNVDGLGAKFVLRIVSGRLRLGVGDPTVLEALALARLGDRKYRKDLEKAYNETSDLGLIAQTLWLKEIASRSLAMTEAQRERLLKAVMKMKIAVGRPLRSELCERLPNPEKTIEKMLSVVSQFKYDGFRTQMHFDRRKGSCRLFSRNLEETTHAFPELLKGVMDQVDADSVILDAEALAYHPESEEFFPFQETTKRRRKYDIEAMAEQLPLRAFVFDILYKNGEPLVDLPVRERLKILDQTIKKNVYADRVDTLIVSESRYINEVKELGLMLDEALTRGLEGLVVKKVDSPYEAGARNFNWVKLKHDASEHLKDTVVCVVLGYIYGRGKRTAFGVGALLVGVYNKEKDMFVSISKIGTGLSDEEWVEVRKRCDDLVAKEKPPRVESLITPSVWVEPEVVIEVLADEITRSPLHTAGKNGEEAGYALRFPRLVSFRDKDKRPEDATSVEEIKKLYEMQGKKE